MDELIRARSVLRVRSDADGNSRLELGVRRPARETGIGYGGAEPLGDLECLGVRCVGQQDSELLSAEAGGNVLRSHVLLEHAAYAAQHGVAGQVAVGIVDLAEKVEVGEKDGHRASGRLRLLERTFDRDLEVARVEEAGLRVPPRLVLEQRNLEPLPKEQQGRDGKRCEPWVRQADGRDRGSHGCEQQLACRG